MIDSNILIIVGLVFLILVILFIAASSFANYLRCLGESKKLEKELAEQKKKKIKDAQNVEDKINESNKLKEKINTGDGKSDFDACNDIMSKLSKKRTGKS